MIESVVFGAQDDRGIAATTLSQMIGVSISKGNPRYLFMDFVNDLKKNTMTDVFTKRIEYGVIVATDGFSSYEASAKEIHAPCYSTHQRRRGTSGVLLGRYDHQQSEEVH